MGMGSTYQCLAVYRQKEKYCSIALSTLNATTYDLHTFEFFQKCSLYPRQTDHVQYDMSEVM